MARIAIVGSGSMVFTQQVVSDLLSYPECRNMDFRLVDIDRGRLDTSTKMVARMIEEVGGKGKATPYENRREALRGVDYCVNSIQVGGFSATESDFEIPRRFGVEQTIGDTLGIGGIFRGLRTIPAVLEIARDLSEESPNAVFLNYTNPMSMVIEAIHEVLPGLKSFGLCHSVHYTAEKLATYVGVPFSELTWQSAGINHMAWMLKLEHEGGDLYPRLFQLAKDPETFGKDPVRFELMEHLGYFVTESSEHNAEYSAHFLPHPSEVSRLSIPIGEYLRRSRNHLDEYADVRRRLENPNERFLLHSSPEYAPAFVHAMESGTTWWFQGNVSNHAGLIPNLPTRAAVEVPCLVNQHGCLPTSVEVLPEQLAAMNRVAINVQTLTVEAAITGNRDAVYQAAMMDPLLAAQLPLSRIWQLVDEMFQAHGTTLPTYSSRRLWAYDH